MGKKEYIGNLYRLTQGGENFKTEDVIFNPSENSAAPEKTLSKAQQRRLSDVYSAKLDLMGRMERSAKKLAMLNDELESIIEKRKKASLSLQESLEKIKNLTEPDGGRELHDYLREVEHMRMEYFRMEAEIEPLLAQSSEKNTSSADDVSSLNAAKLFKIGFYGAMPLIITILTGALIVGLAVIFAMKV